MRNYLLIGVAGLAMTLGSVNAWAGPIALPAGTPLFSGFHGVEQFSPINATTNGGLATSGTTGADCAGCVNASVLGTEGNWGVGFVNFLDTGSVETANEQIVDSGNQLFHSTPGGNEVVFMFYGIHINTPPGSTPVLADGGVIDLYWWDSNTESQTMMESQNPATARTAPNQFSGVTCGAPALAGASGCQLLAELDFVPGAASLGAAVDPTVTVASNTNPANAQNTGVATFYAEVDPTAGGAWASQLAGQYFSLNLSGQTLPDTADVFAQDNFINCSGCNPGWANGSTTFADTINDPVEGFTVAEPGSLALLGSGLVALGLFRRRQKRRGSAVA